MSRVCDEVQGQLPAYVARSLPPLRRRLVAQHLRRCTACQTEHSTQRDVAAGLRALAVPAPDEAPPEGLLDALLDSAARPGVRERVAVPARGAVSGARPALSVALLVAGAAASTGVGWGAVRAVRAVRARRR